MPDILEEAITIINGDRRDAYGDVKESFQRLADMWSIILEVPVTPSKVALCMLGLKISREINAHKRDNLVDMVGYTKLLSIIEGDEDEAIQESN